jgi:hypothetical protein
MTTVVATSLAGSLQALIDARLDTIDRMLLGRVPRADRVAIVREVESQIHELLAQRDPERLGREDVLEVLQRLDPPEAYLPEDAGEDRERDAARRFVPSATAASSARRDDREGEGRLGGILGVSALGTMLLTPLFYIVAGLLDSELLLFAALFVAAILGLAGGLSGLVLGIRGRSQGSWPILGIVSGAIALVLSLALALLVVLQLL